MFDRATITLGIGPHFQFVLIEHKKRYNNFNKDRHPLNGFFSRTITTRMWANAQRDACWSPCQIQVAPSVQRCKVWLTPSTRMPCSNAAKTRKPFKFAGVPQTRQQSQPLVWRSSPYYEEMWRRYRCLTSFFPIVDACLSSEDIARQNCAMVPKWRFFAPCIFSEPRAAHFRHAF